MKTLHFIVMTCLLMFALSANAVEQITYYHSDAAGSPIAATDGSGNLLWDQAYDAWGVPIPSSSGDPRGFTGASRDSDTGLSDLQARWYSPELGRMLAMDPVSFHEGNIQSFNLYAYGNNNPFRYEDPNGESPLEVFTEGVPAFGKSLGAWGALIVGGVTGDWALYYAGQDGLNELRADNIAALAASAAPPATSRVWKIAKQGDAVTSTSVSAMRRFEYVASPKHGRSARQTSKGVSNPAPTDGQHALDVSIQVKSTSSRRVGVDKANKEIVVFDQTSDGVFHGHVRKWKELTNDQQNALRKSGMVDSKGNL